jgi:hypothetical protein
MNTEIEHSARNKRAELLELLGISKKDYQSCPLVHAVVTHLEVGTSPAYLLGKMLAQLAGVEHTPSKSNHIMPLNGLGLDELVANGQGFDTPTPERKKEIALYSHEHP